MCGIAGLTDRRGRADHALVEKMLQQLSHRGPDSTGTYVAGPAAIGQNRLAIIDLVTGDPPIETPDGSIGVAFNGEIYNFASLRAELLQRGHDLRTSGDTEVIAHLAEELEPASLARRLDGMFAFAVWDSRRDRLVVGRDRFGKKPLFYWTDGRDVVFGSEIKALLSDPRVPRRLDERAVPAYLTFGYVPTPRTFFDGIVSLPPGHVLVADGQGVSVEPYWQLRPAGVAGVTLDDRPLDVVVAECRQLLGDAVERRLIADVPLGAFLSGGIDSSTIVALMVERSRERVRTFTIGFDDRDGFDERPHAELVARHFGTDHTAFVVRPNEAELLERISWHFDQPFADSSALPTYLLSELTQREVTVALCGDGGDEVFAGYERFAAASFAEAYARIPEPVRRGAARLAGALPGGPLAGKATRFLDRAGMGMPHALRSWISYIPAEDVDVLVPGGDRWHIADYDAIWAESVGARLLHRTLHLNIRTYLLDDLLPKVDRMSMAHGLEVRAPFLDPTLAAFCLRQRPTRLIRGRTLKWLLKRTMRGIVPNEILDRGKRGFGIPIDRWFRTDLRTLAHSALARGASLRNHVDAASVDRILAEHDAGRNRGAELWSLLMLELFLQREGW